MSGSQLPRCAARLPAVILAALAAMLLTSCQSLGPGSQLTAAETPPAVPVPAETAAEVLGSGPVRVALLVPRSGGGNGAASATAFRNASELALRDFPNAGIQVAVYDTKGSPSEAQVAVGSALAGGAELIIGPVFSGEVAAVAGPARQAGVPVVAFSSDAGVAGPGVYLLSFLPSQDVDRAVSYAASQGRKSFAALLPANAYGSVAEAAFRRAVANAGGRVIAIQTYAPDLSDVSEKTASIAGLSNQIDALFVPDGPAAVPTIATALSAGGLNRERTKLLGSGQWDDPRILNNPALVGGWYPAPVRDGFEEFSRKYQAAYGSVPPRNATLGYDATVLAAGLVRQYGEQRFSPAVLTSANGFAGVDGVFRFVPGGLAERRLAIFEVTGSGSRLIAPAARSFAAGS